MRTMRSHGASCAALRCEALDVAPSTFVPSVVAGEILVVPASEGRLVPSSERPHSAVGRVVLADDACGLEIYEYRATRDEDLNVRFSHEGDKVLHVIGGRLRVEFERPDEPDRVLGAGDTIIHTGTIPHRWSVVDEPVHLSLVVTRRPR